VQTQIRPCSGDFFLKINKRACTSIQHTRVLDLQELSNSITLALVDHNQKCKAKPLFEKAIVTYLIDALVKVALTDIIFTVFARFSIYTDKYTGSSLNANSLCAKFN
jgi:hypothetical protein